MIIVKRKKTGRKPETNKRKDEEKMKTIAKETPKKEEMPKWAKASMYEEELYKMYTNSLEDRIAIINAQGQKPLRTILKKRIQKRMAL